MRTTDKPKVKETGAQMIGLGAVGSVAASIYNLVTAAGAESLEDQIELLGQLFSGPHSWLGIAAIAIGAAYRGFCKWLDTRGVDTSRFDQDIDNLMHSIQILEQGLTETQRRQATAAGLVGRTRAAIDDLPQAFEEAKKDPGIAAAAEGAGHRLSQQAKPDPDVLGPIDTVSADRIGP